MARIEIPSPLNYQLHPLANTLARWLSKLECASVLPKGLIKAQVADSQNFWFNKSGHWLKELHFPGDADTEIQEHTLRTSLSTLHYNKL